jgi:predicted nucleic acid-binding protein
LLIGLEQGNGTLLLSVALALEYEAVCQRPEQRLATGLSQEEVSAFVNTLIEMAEPVETHFVWRPQLRDPNDEMVLATAVNGRADALVTFNLRDYGKTPARFGVEILLPRQALARVNK